MGIKFSRLNQAGLKRLSPRSQITEHGITAERLGSGDIRYSINVMVNGQRIHRIIGRESEGVTRFQAEQTIETLKTRAREERLNLPQGRKLHRGFGEAALEYLQRMEQAAGKDLGNKTRHLKIHLIPSFRHTRLDQITEFALRTYRKRRTDAGASQASVNRELATLLHLMNRAVDWKWIRAEHKPRIPRVAEQRKARRALLPREATALIRAAMEDRDARLWLFVAIGLGTGMRHSEILRRRYDEIDWPANRFEIDKAKAGARLQPFPEWVRDALRRQQSMEVDPVGWIFPAGRKDCKTPYRTDMHDGFRRAAIHAGLDPAKVTPHLMRHTLVTNLSKCVDIATIQKISGHKTAAMVMHYTHINDERIDLALRGIRSAFPKGISPKLHKARSSRAPDRAGASRPLRAISAT